MKKYTLLTLLAALMFIAIGCTTTDREKIRDFIDKYQDYREEQKEEESPDAVPFSDLQWIHGGFKTGEGQIVAEIGNLAVSVRDGDGDLTYQWVSGGCEAMGASSASDAACICAVFGYVDGAWKGGKFDWISTSRTHRGLEHCWGYNGWDSTVMEQATAFAFVIVSKDGSTRTNIITVDK